MGDWARADTGGMQGFGGGAASVGVLPRADSVAASRGGGGGRLGGAMSRPGTAKLGPVPRRPPSIMPVQRPRSAAIGGAAQAAAAGPLPPPGKISAHAFRVEKKGQYQGELNVPSILFIGKAGEPADRSLAKQKRGELSKYKLRPGALEELDIEVDAEEEQDFDASLPRAGGATSPKKKSVSYDMAPYGGKREMDSLRKQIVETETAALESRIQSQMVMSKTKSTVSMVEEKVGHVRESNQQLDSELVEIEKQIEELKRISRSQIDEIKTLRESNKHKETKLHSEQQNLERMEGSVRDSMLIAQEAKEQEKLNKPSAGAAQNREQTSRAGPGAGDAPGAGAGAGAGTGSGPGQPRFAGASASGAAAGPGPSFESGSGEPAYKGDKGEKPADHPEIQCLLELGDHLGQTDGRVWSQGGERRDKEQHFLALHASEDYVQVPPWLASSKPPSDWAENKGSRKLGFQACNVDLPRTDLEIEHVYGFSGSWSVDAMSCTATGKLVYPAASLCVINDVAHSRQRFFGGHSDGVLCLALHADGRMVASGDVGKSSKVLVWDSEEPELPPAVSLWGFHQAGIGGLSFSRDGNKLVTVGRDVDHSLCVWDWRKEERLVSCKTGANPPLTVRFDPVTSVIITAGVRHLKFWTMVGARMEVSLADFKKKGSLQTFLSLAFMRVRNSKEGVSACTTLTGTQDGSLYLWNTKGELIMLEKKAHEGPVTILVAPFQGDEECGNYAFSGGADGKVRRWDAHATTGLSPIWTIDLEEKTRPVFAPFASRKFPVRGIAYKNDRIYVGTCMNEIYQFAIEPVAKVARAPDVSMVVMQAHTQGTLHALDVHPVRPEFVTVAWDCTLRIWDTESRECKRAVQMLPYDEERVAATAVQYSPDGEHVSVGFENGDVWVFDVGAIAAAAQMNQECDKLFLKNSDSDNVKLMTTKGKGISVLRYRPDGVLLAAACLGGKVTIFLVQDEDGQNAYETIKAFRAHQCNVRSLDFSEDCKLMQSTGVDNQILYWQMETQEGEVNPVAVREVTDSSGKVKHGVQDVVWATWTSALGWPLEGFYDANRHNQHVRTSAFASRDRHLVLAWDDKDVLLYNYPCRPGAVPRRFKGHASVPAQARFLQQDRGVVSIGTTDMCIIQWKPPNVAQGEMKQSDAEVVALINRFSQVREEGLIVRLTLEEESDVATYSSTAASIWKEFSSGIAELLKVSVERLELVRILAGSLMFDVLLRPHALGWNVRPTASELLSRLENVYENGLIHRKFPKILGRVEVLQGAEEPDDDFMGIKPWLGVINPPDDWAPDRGSKMLNYAPTCRLKEFASGQGEVEAMLIPEPRPLSLIAYEDDPHSSSAVAPDQAQQAAPGKLLRLDYVHGYQGWGGGGNLFYEDTEHLVYSAGRIGVVHHVPSNTQRFMLGHKDQIASLAKLPVQPGSDKGLPSSTFATGELGQRGSIRIWRSSQPGHAPVQTVGLQGFHNCDVVAMCFMSNDILVSIGSDVGHHVALWDLRMQKLVSSSRGDVNPILAVDSASKGSFVSVGVSHIKFWRYAEASGLLGHGGIFGNKGHVQTMLCVKSFFADDDQNHENLVTITGTEDGSIYVWKNRMLRSNMRGVHKGPVFSLCIPDAHPNLVLSGGKDAAIAIHLFDSTDDDGGLTTVSVIDTMKLMLPQRMIPERRSIRALACWNAEPGWLRLAFGTSANDVLQVEIDVRNLHGISLLRHTLCTVVHGHAGSAVKALCAHPDFPEFATAGQEGMLRLWNATHHSLSACVKLGHAGSAIDYNLALNQHLAVGLAEGGVIILNASAVRQGLQRDACFVLKVTDRRCEITDVKYSPDGHYLAVASVDNVIDIYVVKTSYTRWGVCRGHRDTIRHLDWATDSTVIRSNDTSQELLYWNVKEMRKGAIETLVGSRDLNQVAWSCDSCPMTWASQGTCASYQFVSEISAVDRSRNGALLAAADVFGRVRLFRFPSLEGGLNQLFEAHAGPVTNVKFTFDDSFLLSTCSADMCLLQWKVDVVPDSIDADVAEVLQAQRVSGPVPSGHAQGTQDGDQHVEMEMFKPFHAGVFAPQITNSAGKILPWEPDPSMFEVPKQELELETVHGCRGHDQHAHACFNSRFHAVYYTAKIVVVQDREYSLQRFFLGHTEDVSCIAPHPQGRIFASGQTGTKGLICVWDSQRQGARILQGGRQRSLCQIASFEAAGSHGIAVMSFSARGAHLVSVSQNFEHELTLWDWRNGVALSVVKGTMNRTLAIACNRFPSASGASDCFVTCGVKHVRFWDVVRGQFVCRKADLASRGVMSIQISCTFCKEYAITGNQEGHLYIWKDACLVTCLRDAHKGPVFALHTAAQMSEGNAVFCSAAGDGVVKLWTIRKNLVPKAQDVKQDGEVGDQDSNARKMRQPASDFEVHCFESEGVQIRKVIEGLNVPSIGQAPSVRAAYIQFEPNVKTISADGVWRILIATSINELYQLTLPQLISAPNDRTTEVHRGQLQRETVKVYNAVTYGNDGVGTEQLPAIQLLVQAHTPPHVAGSVGAQPSDLTLDAASSIRALAVHPESENEFSTCGADGVLRIWDMQQARVRFMYRLGETVQSICYSAVHKDCWHLAIGCRGKIKIMDASVPLVFGDDITVLAVMDKSKGVGTRDAVTCVKYSSSCNSQGFSYLAAGLSSGSIVVYTAPINEKQNAYEVKVKFNGHSGPVLHMDFSKQAGGDAENLQSNCSRFELRFWDLKRCKEVKAASDMRNEKWESLTCPLSWTALGMKADEYSVVPCVDRSPDHPCLVGAIWPEAYKLLALSGMGGQVTLARDPFLQRAHAKSWPAHSMPPAAVRFTFGSQSVVSVGDVDMSVCVWRRQLPVHVDVQRVLDVPCSMKAKLGEADALFLAKEHGSHEPAAGEQLGSQAAFDDAKPFLTHTKMFKAVGWDNFHPDDLESAGRTELTKYELKLKHVHGSRGHCAMNNVLYNEKGQAVYVTAQVALVQQGDVQVQHFQAHDDDILCIDISNSGKLAATGQVGEKGKASIWIWNAVNSEKVQKIDYPRDGGVYAVSFKPTQGESDMPQFLASVANDEDCTIDVWDFREGINNYKLLACIAGDKNRILSVRWNPFYCKDEFGSLVTLGDKHLQFWLFAQAVPSEDEQLDMDGGARTGAVSLVRHKPLWKDTTKQTCLSMCFVEKTKADASDEGTEHGYTITGMQDGSIFFWKWLEEETGIAVIKVLPSLHDGPIFTLLTTSTGLLLSGGNDGYVMIWKIETLGDMGAPVLRRIDMASVHSSGTCVSKVIAPSVRSLSARVQGGNEISMLVGTASNEIYEMAIAGDNKIQSRLVVQGHGGEQVQGLASHPEKDWFATVGHDGVVRVWDLEERACTYAALLKDDKGQRVGGKALCFRGKVDRPVGIQECPVCHYGTVEKERTFHCDELAVGTLCGQVVIFKMAQGGQLLECARTQYRTKAITCLQYAPTGTLLAVASEDMVVDVFLPDENHRRVGVCKGHMAPIMSIDWTEDGEFMQTSDTALELMFWCMQTRTEKTVPEFVSHSKPILLYKKQWANYTTPLGWPWHGIYTPGSEGVGLNAVHRLILDRQSKKALGVSASANGVVKLFPYPNQPGMSGMQAQTYEGHSAAVSKVRFSAKGDYVVSVGGRDCTIIQWEVLAPTKELGALDADAGQGKATASDDDDSEDELDRLQREGAVKKLTADQQYNEKGRSM